MIQIAAQMVSSATCIYTNAHTDTDMYTHHYTHKNRDGKEREGKRSCLTLKETGNGRPVDSKRGRNRLVFILVLYTALWGKGRRRGADQKQNLLQAQQPLSFCVAFKIKDCVTFTVQIMDKSLFYFICTIFDDFVHLSPSSSMSPNTSDKAQSQAN